MGQYRNSLNFAQADSLVGRPANTFQRFARAAMVCCWMFALTELAGCGRATPAPVDPTSASSAVSDAPSVQAAGAGQAEVASDADLSPHSPLAVTSEPTSIATNNKQATVSTSTTTPSTNRSTAPASEVAASKAVPPVEPPSPELIAKWSIGEYPSLQLLACYDGYRDPIATSLAVSPDGKQFVVGGARLTVWKTGQPEPQLDLLENLSQDAVERPIRVVTTSPDGRWLAAGDQDGGLRLYNMSDHSQALAIKTQQGRMVALAFSPNSQQLATTSYSGEVKLWHVPDGKLERSFKASDREIGKMLYVSDDLMAIGSGETSVWNLATGKQHSVLSTGYVMPPALAISHDRKSLAFADADGQVRLWNVQEQKIVDGPPMSGHGLCFSHDDKWLASHAAGWLTIWDVSKRQVAQVIDTTGSEVAELKWLPREDLLLVASNEGRVRVWGLPEAAKKVGVEPMQLPVVADADPKLHKPFTESQLHKIFDIRTFPRLPGAKNQMSHANVLSYQAPIAQDEAVQFYRYVLVKAGWTEMPAQQSGYLGLSFAKSGSQLHITFLPMSAVSGDALPASPAPTTQESGVHVSMNHVGNYDARWLPQVEAIPSKNTYGFFSTVSYRTRAELTGLETELLKKLHAEGWTAYTRLDASSREEPLTRTLWLLQGGSELTVSIGPPADSTDELAVQTSLSLKEKTLPIPPDSGWIEFDSSTAFKMVANTKMDLATTLEFYDKQMSADGWQPRQAGRLEKDGKAWMPFIRGGQYVSVRLISLPDGTTRVLVGDVEQSSWQLQEEPKPADTETESIGIEVADLAIPAEAKEAKYDVEEKQIRFRLDNVAPTKLAEQFVTQLTAMGWKQERAGVQSDEYMFVTLSKAKAELQLRATLVEAKNCTAIISGDGLLWTKPLPSPPARISYETWLRRNRHRASLDLLDQFTSEMKKIPRS